MYLLWLGLLGLVVIFVGAMGTEALRIERSLTQQTGVVIKSAGYTRVLPDVRGRDLHLTGFVSSMEGKRRVEQLAATVAGVRRINSTVEVAVSKLPWLRLVTDDGGALTLWGHLPRQQDLDHVMSVLTANGMEVQNNAEVDIEVGTPDWWPLLLPVLEMADFLERYRMEIGAKEIMVGGRAKSTIALNSALEALRVASDSMALRLTNRIAILSG